jgi:predicted short-subunit dehydrogenase-like oxidoreductase (DUF2520 family)
MKNEQIVLLGAGNLAVNLGKALYKAGFVISQVYSRTMDSAMSLASELNTEAITNISLVDKSATTIIFALNDSVINEVLDKLEVSDTQLLLHTSGSVHVDVFKNKAPNYGVLYPLQTFSKFRQIQFWDIPVFIEANTKENLARTMQIAREISLNIYLADSAQRQTLHLSGVFMNNFVNYFYSTGSRLSKELGCHFGFDVFKPIILETALKAIESGNPETCQTGPAFRKNKEIVAKHYDMLQKNPEMQNLYTFVTNNISTFYHNETLIG